MISTRRFARHALMVVGAMLVSIALFAVPACVGQHSPSSPTPAPVASVTTVTVGPLGVGRHAVAAGYDVVCSKGVIATAAPGPGVPAVPSMCGLLRVDIRIEVRSAHASQVASVPFGPLRLVDSTGRSMPRAGTVWSRSQLVTLTSPLSSGTGEFFATPLRPGETVTLEPSFFVPATVKGLTLLWSPRADRPVVVSFHVR